MAGYWTVATEPQRENTAVHFLGLAGFETYLPRIQLQPARSQARGRAVPLFPCYVFILVALQWHNIKRGFGIRGLIMDGQ
jgi:hypothetical protein